MYIGQVVYMQQGTAGNLPFAAAFSLVPILIIAIYLTIAKRLGLSMRFDTHVSLIHTSSRVPILIMAIHLTTAKRLGLSMRSNTSMKRDHGNQPSGLLQVRCHRRPLVPALSDPVHLPLRLHQREQELSVPAPGLTLKWFEVTLNRPDVARHPAVAGGSGAGDAGRHGTRHSGGGAIARSRFFGQEVVSLLLVLPIALPGIVTGIALRSAYGVMEIPFSFWTIVIGHATFCVVVVSTMPWRAFAAPTRAS